MKKNVCTKMEIFFIYEEKSLVGLDPVLFVVTEFDCTLSNIKMYFLSYLK